MSARANAPKKVRLACRRCRVRRIKVSTLVAVVGITRAEAIPSRIVISAMARYLHAQTVQKLDRSV
jgi:hypothetical protein